jgi:hypothetical protein
VESLNTPQKVILARALHRDKSHSIEGICRTLHISRATLYRYLSYGADDRRPHGEDAELGNEVAREQTEEITQS